MASRQSRPRYCRFCQNHDIQAPLANHKQNCPFKDCFCPRCCQVRDRNQRERERRNAANNSSSQSTSTNSSNINVAHQEPVFLPPGPSNARPMSAAAIRAANARKRQQGQNKEISDYVTAFFKSLTPEESQLSFMTNVTKAFKNYQSKNGQTPMFQNQLPPSCKEEQKSTQNSSTDDQLLTDLFPEIPQSTLDSILQESGSSIENVVDQLLDAPNTKAMLNVDNSGSSVEPGLSAGPLQMGHPKVGDVSSCNDDDIRRLRSLFPDREAEIPVIFVAMNFDFRAALDYLVNLSSTNSISFSGPNIPHYNDLPVNNNSVNLSRGSIPGGPSCSTSDVPGRRPQRCQYCGTEWPSRNDHNYCPHCGMLNRRFRY